MMQYYSLDTPKSTQILDKNVKVDKRLRPNISMRSNVSNLFEVEPEKVYATSESWTGEEVRVLEKMQCRHGLVAAVLQAYNGHQHLCFSPDDIWLTIAQGVSAHINFNFEKEKNKFVKLNERENIILKESNSSSESRDWSKCVDDLVEETTKLIEKVDLKSLLECDFSTSTSSTITASRVILLESMKNYYSYNMGIFCGIPKITLEGRIEDWLLIQEKLIRLRNLNLDLDFWLNDLDSIICQFIETFKGNVDRQFWKNIAKEDYGCGGPPELTGWITKFFPYDCNGDLVNNWLDESTLPDGRTTITFNLEKGEKDSEDLLFASGFLGVKQQIIENSDEVIVKPVIGWAIICNRVKESPILNTNNKKFRLFWC
ncbi:3048_t:CDS:1 [Funneliformis mosseae]|uniref:3048_t:CDS:1 n=1 Tax=Funneliformis mosseae TaxID=27381 RepID=A0A9N9C698_FUNMO|nr:3048_t:CDS:1 [Funneliformis mosseae]